MSASSRPRAAVVGGGICGLASAIGLIRRGWEVTVFEETESVVVGAGITIWANGLAALGWLGAGSDSERAGLMLGAGSGLVDEVRAHANDLTSVRILDWRGRELMRQRSEPGAIIALHRRDLNAALVGALPAGVVRTSTPATVTDAYRGVVAWGDREESFDLVVAADGVHSPTRQRWWPASGGERDCGIRAWRAVITGSPQEAVTVWGPSGECGILPLPGDTAYVFGASRGTARAEGLPYFADWVEPIGSLIGGLEDPIVHDLTDLDPVRQPVKGRTVVVGDAAHAMRPHLGQGAGLSLEDAVVLAQCCSSSGVFDAVRFRAARRRRWAAVSWLARRVTPLMMPSNRVLGSAHAIAPFVPDRMALAVADRIAGWRPALPSR